jgi:hypothetical protein
LEMYLHFLYSYNHLSLQFHVLALLELQFSFEEIAL